MKKIIAALILAALAASPAMAKSTAKASRHHAAPVAEQAALSYAAAPGYMGRNVAISYGSVVGQDPDPTVRLELERASPLFSAQ
jgi:hypothetical protein